MGGPYWAKKDAGAWSIPKGLFEPGENALAAAKREFFEEVGFAAPDTEFELLGEFRQPSGKVVSVFGAEHSEAEFVGSNLFELEWPPKSGRMQQFPEMIDAQWMSIDVAREKLLKGQRAVLEKLVSVVSG